MLNFTCKKIFNACNANFYYFHLVQNVYPFNNTSNIYFFKCTLDILFKEKMCLRGRNNLFIHFIIEKQKWSNFIQNTGCRKRYPVIKNNNNWLVKFICPFFQWHSFWKFNITLLSVLLYSKFYFFLTV